MNKSQLSNCGKAEGYSAIKNKEKKKQRFECSIDSQKHNLDEQTENNGGLHEDCTYLFTHPEVCGLRQLNEQKFSNLKHYQYSPEQSTCH
jgi:hypothetical protein